MQSLCLYSLSQWILLATCPGRSLAFVQTVKFDQIWRSSFLLTLIWITRRDGNMQTHLLRRWNSFRCAKYFILSLLLFYFYGCDILNNWSKSVSLLLVNRPYKGCPPSAILPYILPFIFPRPALLTVLHNLEKYHWSIGILFCLLDISPKVFVAFILLWKDQLKIYLHF